MTPLRHFAVGVGVLGLILAATLASSGSTGMQPLGHNRWAAPSDTPSWDLPDPTPDARFPSASPTPLPELGKNTDAVSVITTIFVIVLLLAISYLAYYLIRKLLHDIAKRRSIREVLEFDPRDLPEAEAVADIQEALEATHARLLRGDGDVDQVIVACWRELEALAARYGNPREATQTSSEFAGMFLRRTGADPAAVAELADLYRQVQFSHHLTTEEHRQQALASLRAVMTSF